MPPVPLAGVPERIPPDKRLKPSGKLPVVMENIGEGKPLALTKNLAAAPATKVVLSAEVMAAIWLMVSVNACVASALTPLLALITNEWLPLVPADGIPDSSPVADQVTPFGKVPESRL